MPDCTNDCRNPLDFPRDIFNRPGLPHIGYRIGTWADFREALVRKLNAEPVLSAWTYRGSDDPGIALMESSAILGDILTFYQELYANEVFLETATLRQSVSQLVRLTGYRLSPGVGGQGLFAFEVSQPVTIPAGFPVTADVTGLEDPSDFETTDHLHAVPALSKFWLYRPWSVPAITSGAKVLAINTGTLTGAAVTLEKGNRLMLISGSYRQVAVVESVAQHFEQTEITLKGAWLGPATTSVTAYKLNRDFRHFGYNAPPTETVITGGTAEQQSVSFDRTLGPAPFGRIGFSAGIGGTSGGLTFTYFYDPIPTGEYIPLDKEVDDFSPGTTVLIQADSGVSTVFAIRQVESVRKGSLTWGALTGASTILQIDGYILSGFMSESDIRSVQIHETSSPALTLTAVRQEIASPTPATYYFFGNGVDYQALDGRRLQLQRNQPKPGVEAAIEETTASITPSSVGDPALETLRPVKLQPELKKLQLSEFPLSFPPKKSPVLVYGNLVTATQGKTEKPVVLGSGDARATFQTFAIPKAPLTWLISTSATPPEVPELAITVDNIEWIHVSSLLEAGPKDQVFIVRDDENGVSYVQFGDGETGARLPSGVGNILCTYRTSIGAFGPLKPGAAADAGARATGLADVYLLDQVTGGAEAEDASVARMAAPGRMGSLGRLVSLADYRAETLAIPGVSAASAQWSDFDGVPTIVMTVLMETGRAAELTAVTGVLATYNICRGPQRHPVIVRAGRRVYLFVDVQIALTPGWQESLVFAEVRKALGVLFDSAARQFGEREYRTRIEGAVQNVPGVAWNSVIALGSMGAADDPSTLVLPGTPRPRAPVIGAADDTILALYDPHLTLTVVAAPVGAC